MLIQNTLVHESVLNEHAPEWCGCELSDLRVVCRNFPVDAVDATQKWMRLGRGWWTEERVSGFKLSV